MRNQKTLNFLPYSTGVSFVKEGFTKTLQYGTVLQNNSNRNIEQTIIMVESKKVLGKLTEKDNYNLVKELESKVVKFWNDNPNAMVRLSHDSSIVLTKDKRYSYHEGYLREIK